MKSISFRQIATLLTSLAILSGCSTSNDDSKVSEVSSQGSQGRTSNAVGQDEDRMPDMRFGVKWEFVKVDSGKVKSGQSLSHLLDGTGFGQSNIAILAENSKKVWDVRYMRADHRWWLAYEFVLDSLTNDEKQQPKWLVYERNPKEYALFSLGDTLGVKLGAYPVDTVYARALGTIEKSLYLDFEATNQPTNLAVAMANVYAWTIDFSRVQQGDSYDVLYSREMVNGQTVGMPTVLASTFTQRNRPQSAFRFETSEGTRYFDEEGASLQKAFLKAPVEFSRISSRYNPKRFHPILKKVKGHFGTDYAAPEGTPIVAVGDGVVTKSSFTSGNGNYVKIRHNSTYETQYLHMSKRAVNEGQRVSQGEVIGYVGQTGLATGPHVCYRFWKNGQQVDHLLEEFPPSEPIAPELQEQFQLVVNQFEEARNSLAPNASPVSLDVELSPR